MAGGVGAASSSSSLQYTPTWAVATVCFVFIAVSLFIEHLIELLCKWLKKHRKTALFEAVEKLKSGKYMLIFKIDRMKYDSNLFGGYCSVDTARISIAIVGSCNKTGRKNMHPESFILYTMLPCRKTVPKAFQHYTNDQIWTDKFVDVPPKRGRFLDDGDDDHDDDDRTKHYSTNLESSCESKGMTSIISEEGMYQLSIFFFVLAVMQIVYSIITAYLGRAKMARWKVWEKETETVEYQAANDPNRFRYTRETTFGRRHMTLFTGSTFLLWTKCFFRQFFNSVARVDYLTLRHGFISQHLSANNAFNFQKYIQRSLEDDFKLVVGISPFMWLLVVIFMLVDVHGWHVYLWVSFLPLTIVLVLGTKLEVIVVRMALQIKDKSSVLRGTPLVQLNDELFWFHDPKHVLTLLHFTLFMNAFELAFFVWVTTQFGIKSCYHEHIEIIIVRIVLAVTVQVICGYITLPLYALVTQMGSQFKSAVLQEQTASVIKKWHDGAKKKRNKYEDSSHSSKDRSIGQIHLSSNIENDKVNMTTLVDHDIGEDLPFSQNVLAQSSIENADHITSNLNEITEEDPEIVQDQHFHQRGGRDMV